MKEHRIFSESFYSGWDSDVDEFIGKLKTWKKNAKKQGFTGLKLEIHEDWDYDTCTTELVLKGKKGKKKCECWGQQCCNICTGWNKNRKDVK
jgi:hypothetical protein